MTQAQANSSDLNVVTPHRKKRGDRLKQSVAVGEWDEGMGGGKNDEKLYKCVELLHNKKKGESQVNTKETNLTLTGSRESNRNLTYSLHSVGCLPTVHCSGCRLPPHPHYTHTILFLFLLLCLYVVISSLYISLGRVNIFFGKG